MLLFARIHFILHIWMALQWLHHTEYVSISITSIPYVYVLRVIVMANILNNRIQCHGLWVGMHCTSILLLIGVYVYFVHEWCCVHGFMNCVRGLVVHRCYCFVGIGGILRAGVALQ